MRALDSKPRAFVARDLATIVDTRSEKDAAGAWWSFECVIALVTVAKVGARIRCERLPNDSHGREFHVRDGQWVGYGATDGRLRERRPGDEAALKVAGLREKWKDAEYRAKSASANAETAHRRAATCTTEALGYEMRASGYFAERDRLDAEIAALEKEAGDG